MLNGLKWIKVPQELMTHFVEEALKPGVVAAYTMGVSGQTDVRLVTRKGRPMFSVESETELNFFRFDCFREQAKPGASQGALAKVPVPAICVLCGVDARLVHDVFYYLGRDMKRAENFREVEIVKEQARRHLTNLLPFPKILWEREPDEGGFPRPEMVCEKSFLEIAPMELRRQSILGKKHLSRRYRHHLSSSKG